jgi:hypothetical protein
MDDWVKVSASDLGTALGAWRTMRERGEWVTGAQAGCSGALLRLGASPAESAGHAWGVSRKEAAAQDKARLSQERSESGKRGAAMRWGSYPPSQTDGIAIAPPLALPQVLPSQSSWQTDSRGEEKRGEEEQAARAGARTTSAEWHPLQEHRDLAAIRRLDIDAQLARFRNRCGQALDTDEGWSLRFSQWLGTGRPERKPAPALEVLEPPSEAEWMTEAKAVAMAKPPFPAEDPAYVWPAELARSKWAAHQAQGWRGVQDWRAQVVADCGTWAGYEVANRKRPSR